MSAWQFNTKVLPESGLIAFYGKIPKQVDVVSFTNSVPIEELERQSAELPNYWEDFKKSETLETTMAELLPERESWSSMARMFGENDKDEVVIWREENGRLSRIKVSFSMSEPNPDFIRAVLDCVRLNKCKLLALQVNEIFEPTLNDFVTQAERCSAARFIPKGNHLSELLE